MSRKIKCGLVTLSVIFAGCATPPFASEAALKVQVQRQYSTMLDKCKRLEAMAVRVDLGPMGWVHSPIDIATITAENKIREQVSAAGGDTVVFTTMDLVQPGQGASSEAGVQVQAQGFRCKI